MSVVRKFMPEVRLKSLLGEPGGLTAQAALGRAADNLESIRETCLAAIDAKIELLTHAASVQSAENMKRIYRISNEVFAEAGAFELDELSAIAHSLCSLVVAAEHAKVPHAAIAVHVDAMRALRHAQVAPNKAARGAVLAGLRGLTARITKG